MLIKKFENFINESIDKDLISDEIELAKETLLKEGFYLDGSRYSYEGDFEVNYKLSKLLIYKGYFLVPLGVIKGNFKCTHNDLYSSLENLPLRVIGNFNISNCKIKSLLDFSTVVEKGDLDISHNHLHKLENIQEELDGKFDVISNMLTSLEGSPKKVKSLYAKDNWFNTLYGGPIKITNHVIGRNYGEFNFTGSEIVICDKVPDIEKKWYSEKSYYNGNTNKGIVNYHTELFEYIIDNSKDDDERDKYITSIKWPNDMDADRMKKSIKTVSKFNL